MKKRFLCGILGAVICMTSACGMNEGNAEPATSEASVDDPRYQAFLDGKAPAYFGKEWQGYRMRDVEDCFDNDEKFTLDEIISGVKEAQGDYYDKSKKPVIDSSLIDCGMDGDKELRVCISFPGSGDPDMEKVMVVKEVNGELRIVYYWTNYLRDAESVDESGYISVSGAASGDILSGVYGYLDADCKWNFDYYYEYFLSAHDYETWLSDRGIDVDMTNGPWENAQIERYSFDEDFDYFSGEDRSFITTFSVYKISDGKFEDLGDPTIYDDDSVYMKTFKEAGIKAYSPDEIEKLVEKRENPDDPRKVFDAFLKDELKGQKTYSDYVKEDEVYKYDFFDVDNDGVKELALFSLKYYPMAFFDVHDGKVERICGGEGPDAYLKIVEISRKNYLCYYYTHDDGKMVYSFYRMNHKDEHFDLFGLVGNYSPDPNTTDPTYTYKGKEITPQEFEDLKEKMVYEGEVFGSSYIKRKVDSGDSFTLDGQKYYFYASFDEKNNEETYTLYRDGIKKEITIFANSHQAFVVKATDGKDYFWVCTTGDGMACNILVLDFDKFDQEGFIDSGCPYGLYKYMYKGGAYITLASPSWIFGTCSIRSNFYIGDKGIPMHGNMYYYYDSNCLNGSGGKEPGPTVTLKVDMEAGVASDWLSDDWGFVKQVVPAGTKLTMYRTDNDSFIDLMMEDGRIVRFYMTAVREAGRDYDEYKLINDKYSIEDIEGVPYWG
ncbi:hypothetical protein [Butyrivibrio sp. VCB2006]|uniref:hypothetical protein n=1 Tax=Butyrivibrio sp. VCB2006 TaxID=1280679 RepID=UPI0003FE1F8A|nr:hypothetical protein [Butyrivibrio sp. VCB2006]